MNDQTHNITAIGDKMVTLGILSDSHITKGPAFNEMMLLAGIRTLNRLEVDYCIHAGDLTDKGTLDDYNLALDYMSLLNYHYYVIPGNHDAQNVGYKLFEELIGERSFAIEDGKLLILGLDSSIPDANTGRIGDYTLKRLRKKLEEVDDDIYKVVIFHHQLFPIPYTGRERSTCDDSGDILQVLLDYNVNLVVNGHRHISNIYKVADSDGRLMVVNAGTVSCNKTRYRELQSVVNINIDPDTKKTKVLIIPLAKKLDFQDTTNFKQGECSFDCCPEIKTDDLELFARIINISDTHFGPDFVEKPFMLATDYINSLDKVDLVIHTGDVTTNSFIDEFDSAVEHLKRINNKKLVVPGPRDFFSLGRKIWSNYFPGKNPTFENEAIKVRGINTCLLEDNVGMMGRRKLHKTLDEFSFDNPINSEKFTIATFHHHLIPIPDTKFVAGLQDAGDILFEVTRGHINAVLTGHKHIAFACKVEETVITNTNSVSSIKVNSLKGNSFTVFDIYKLEKGGWACDIKEVSIPHLSKEITSRDISSLGKFQIRYDLEEDKNEK
ncbi:MAG: metallophosphoesterase [Candidatus Heimdallarchaeota archaeon]|nr:metallophosphoesterase [Candidatus Heimdallarchaeota archaeon]MCK5048077.1 metallophosphoesterase [Candidatus Heimdallarchaeota archaeon]